MNADGIYLATYSALLLNLRLIQIGHYDKNNTSVSIQFNTTEPNNKLQLIFYKYLLSLLRLAPLT